MKKSAQPHESHNQDKRTPRDLAWVAAHKEQARRLIDESYTKGIALYEARRELEKSPGGGLRPEGAAAPYRRLSFDDLSRVDEPYDYGDSPLYRDEPFDYGNSPLYQNRLAFAEADQLQEEAVNAVTTAVRPDKMPEKLSDEVAFRQAHREESRRLRDEILEIQQSFSHQRKAVLDDMQELQSWSRDGVIYISRVEAESILDTLGMPFIGESIVETNDHIILDSSLQKAITDAKEYSRSLDLTMKETNSQKPMPEFLEQGSIRTLAEVAEASQQRIQEVLKTATEREEIANYARPMTPEERRRYTRHMKNGQALLAEVGLSSPEDLLYREPYEREKLRRKHLALAAIDAAGPGPHNPASYVSYDIAWKEAHVEEGRRREQTAEEYDHIADALIEVIDSLPYDIKDIDYVFRNNERCVSHLGVKIDTLRRNAKYYRAKAAQFRREGRDTTPK